MKPWALTVLVLAMAFAVACSPSGSVSLEPTGPTSEPASPASVGAGKITPDQIREALEASGLRVGSIELQEPESTDVSIFGSSRERTVLEVADEVSIDFFEFESPDEASKAASKVSPDGSTVPTDSGDGIAMVQWVGMPHFFMRGDLIVMYIEKQVEDSAALDSDVLAPLRQLMGDEFAGNRLQ
ncbi:MAG: hypothetical protein KGZ40_08220 [Clostridiales bacterium]|nr:hypothetical protein [Clostridiales bacterium]